MSLLNRAEKFAWDFDAVPYRYENGPVSDRAQDWFVEGLNCQLLIHLLYQDFFKVTLPPELRSSEIFADQDWFDEIDFIQTQEGDLLLLGPEKLNPKKDSDNADAKKLHLAVVVGVGPSIIHARPKVGIAVEPLAEVIKLERYGQKPYQRIYAAKRLKLGISGFNNH